KPKRTNMSNLDKQVLVLNGSWQPIDVMTVQKALVMMSTDVATAMDFSDEGYFVPVRWKDWLELPVRDQGDGINTPSRVIRVPRVIIAIQFNKVPVKRPRLSLKHFREAGQSPMRLHSTGPKARRMFNRACRPAVQRWSHRTEKRGP